MTKWFWLAAVLVCLAAAGCGSSRNVSQYEPLATAEPVVIGSGTSDVGMQSTVAAATPEKPRTEARTERKKIPARTLVPRQSVQELPTSEAPSGAEQASLLLSREDDDENIAALLSPEYMRQFDIPIVFNDAVEYFVRHFSTEKRKVFAGWLKRSKRYAPMIREILREHGLPEDLIYLAMIESGFNAKAYSPARACGPWQFIYSTGGRYGLRVNHWVDERRDPEKSTVAAALYLKDLFNQFGCWHLAAASYNAGEKRIERAIEKHETDNFWELRKYNTLPRETKEYIPRLLAAAIIAKDPEKFGFTNIDYDSPIKAVNERVPGGASLAVIAKAASVDVSTLRGLNPELLTGITPPDAADYTIKLPESTRKERFRSQLAAGLEREGKVRQAVAYTLKKRESLARVLKRYKVTRGELMLVNNCEQDLKIRPGKVVYIPRFSAADERRDVAPETEPDVRPDRETGRKLLAQKKGKEKKGTKVVVASRGKTERSFHVVKKGESLAGISERYGIDLETLKEINSLKKNRVYPNMRLALTSHTEKVHERPARKKGGALFHKVRKGEKLSTIAEKYDTDVQTLKQMNGLKKSKVRAGVKLKVPSGKG
jgi:membrane-bound lytic murein transglycosylase D